MADKKGAASFDDIIQADRKKRKAEALAAQIFGKNRRSSTPVAGKKPAPGGSLASRVGVTKRSSSTASNNRNSSTRPSARPSGPSQLSRNQSAPRGPRDSSQLAAITAAAEVTNGAKEKLQGRQQMINGAGAEITIRGAAGPYNVVAQNFAPGTTAADIESVMLPIGGDMANCRLVSSTPTVIAEMAFLDKAGAENVIAMFNNKKADGRLLHVYMKDVGTSHSASRHSRPAPAPVAIEEPPVEEIMEVDDAPAPAPAPISQSDPRDDRAQRDLFARPARDDRGYREDYPRGPRRAEAEYQDGRYGFGDSRPGPHYGGRDDRQGRYGDGGRMYSDHMRRGGGGRGRGGNGGGPDYRR